MRNSSIESTNGSQDKTDNNSNPLNEFKQPATEGQKLMSNDSGNLFGQIDIEDIDIELTNGTYLCELISVKPHHKPEEGSPNDPTKGKHSIVFTWSVVDEESEKYGATFSQWFGVYPYLTPETMAELSPKDKVQVKRSVTWLKDHLNRLDIDISQLEKFSIEAIREKAEGTRAYIDLIVEDNKEATRKFVKPKKITLEKNADTLANGTDNFSF